MLHSVQYFQGDDFRRPDGGQADFDRQPPCRIVFCVMLLPAQGTDSLFNIFLYKMHLSRFRFGDPWPGRKPTVIEM
jgi:hypothetical protein